MLTGIRVLDLCDETSALASKLLGDLGADVIRIEPPGGDRAGRRAPFHGGVADPERSLPWLALHTSQRGITLDPAHAQGRALLERLLQRADALLESYAPDRRAALALAPELLRAAHPRLVHASITPYGSDGPRAHWRGSDLTLVAMGGNASLTGDPDRPPLRCGAPTAQLHTGPEAALGVVIALHAREATGRGQHVDVSLQECQLQTLLGAPATRVATGRKPERAGARIGRTREIWRACDGFVSFGLRGGTARVPNLVATVAWMAECGMAPDWLRAYAWERFDARAVGADELVRLEDAFAAFFASKTMRELYEEALRRRILLAPCNDARAVLAQPQLRARELFVRLADEDGLEHPDFFARTEDRAIRVRNRAPRIGEHNAEVYGELGIGPAELAQLAASGVV